MPREVVREGTTVGPARYVVVWMILIGLTASTLLVSRMDLGGLSLPIALAIAALKSSLVVRFFMHLFSHGVASRLMFATSGLFVVLLVAFTVLDVATRFPLAVPTMERRHGLSPQRATKAWPERHRP